jgi:hypothetical protein
VAASLSSGSLSLGKEGREATGRSFYSVEGSKAFFVYGFPKSQRANFDDDELRQFKELQNTC